MPAPGCGDAGDTKAIVECVVEREGMGWAWSTWECIGYRESKWQADALNLDTNGYYSRGVFQVNDQFHSWRWQGRDWANPADNAEVAIEIYVDAGGFWPWSTHTDGGC